MNLIEIMKAKGISDDIIQAVQEDMRTNKIFTASEENLDIRYGKLKTDHEAVVKERDEGKALIESLQESNKDNEDIQKQVSEYQAKIAQLQKELDQTKADSAINVGLLAAGVKPEDVDYITFKLKAKGEIELDEQGNIKGWEDKLAGLKTQFPTLFATASDGDGGFEVYKPNHLKKGDGGDAAPSKEQFRAMSFEERMNLKKNNEALYKQYAKN